MMAALMNMALAASAGPQVVTLFAGYVSQVKCVGRLLVSAIGNDRLVQLEPLPKDLGCGVVLKPLLNDAGRTNLLLETSAGSVSLIVVIHKGGQPSPKELTVEVSSQESPGGHL